MALFNKTENLGVALKDSWTQVWFISSIYRSGDGRFNTKAVDFVNQHNLGSPIAGNFFQAQYDDYVPILHAQLA